MTCGTNGITQAYLQIAGLFGGKYLQYRPTGVDSPPNHRRGSLQAAFDSSPALTFTAAEKDVSEPYYAAIDASKVKPADYLVGPLGTFFVSSIEPWKAPICYRCTRTLTISQSAPAAAAQVAGDGGYEGQVQANDVPILTGWPANVSLSQRGEMDVAKLPADTRSAYFKVLFPPLPIVPMQGMYMQDEAGNNYVISSAELSWKGWDIVAMVEYT